jgi:hypothetical protein
MCSYSASRFSFVYNDKKGEKKLTFATPMGIEMDPLIRTYSSYYRKNFKKDNEEDEVSSKDEVEKFLLDAEEYVFDRSRFLKILLQGLSHYCRLLQYCDRPCNKISAFCLIFTHIPQVFKCHHL